MNAHDRDKRKGQWQEWLELVVGIWLAASPWLLGHADQASRPLYNALIVGLAIAVVAGASLIRKERWEPMVSLVLGLWAIASPWIFHFWDVRDLALSTAVSGGIVSVMSLLQVAEHYNFGDRLPQ